MIIFVYLLMHMRMKIKIKYLMKKHQNNEQCEDDKDVSLKDLTCEYY
jgi:hypothetical protein